MEYNLLSYIDKDFIYFTLGIFLPVLLSLIATKISKKSKDKISLTLVHENWLTLLSSNGENFQKLPFDAFKSKNTNNLYLYKGCFINTGSEDIDYTKLIKPVIFKWESDLIFKEFLLSHSSEGTNIKAIYTSEDALEFKWDLLKPSEKLSFDILFESPKSIHQSYGNYFTTDYRITNLKEIRRITVNWGDFHFRNENKRNAWFGILFILGLWVLVLWASIRLINNILLPNVSYASQVVSRTTYKDFNLKKVSADSLIFESPGEKKIIHKSQVRNHIAIISTLIYSDGAIVVLIILVAASIFLPIVSFALIRNHSKENEVYEIISLANKRI